MNLPKLTNKGLSGKCRKGKMEEENSEKERVEKNRKREIEMIIIFFRRILCAVLLVKNKIMMICNQADTSFFVSKS